jgi:hypothetical protein
VFPWVFSVSKNLADITQYRTKNQRDGLSSESLADPNENVQKTSIHVTLTPRHGLWRSLPTAWLARPLSHHGFDINLSSSLVMMSNVNTGGAPCSVLFPGKPVKAPALYVPTPNHQPSTGDKA